MINVTISKCIGCEQKSRVFGFPGERPINCGECKLPGMINLIGIKCVKCGDRYAHYNDQGLSPKYCSDCKLPGMICIRNRRCSTPLCNTSILYNNPYGDLCFRCHVLTHPDDPIIRAYKVKERHVADFIRKHYDKVIYIHYDKKIAEGCSLRRPDILIDMGDYVIIIEIDENQHRRYDDFCEEVRINEIYTDLQDRMLVLLRFNPDGYTDENGEIHPSSFSYTKRELPKISDDEEWEARLNHLKSRVDHWMKNRPGEPLTSEYLFYDN